MDTPGDMRSDGLKEAWKAPRDTKMTQGKGPTPKGSGLKRAWEDQTSKPSLLANMSGAKQKVR
jgi:hypothetical protein